MRSFFGRLSGKDGAQPSPESSPNAGQGKAVRPSVSSSFGWFRGRGGQASGDAQVSEETSAPDVEGVMVKSAAHTLSDAIEGILGNNETLSGEHMSGFIALMRILECEDLEIHATDGNRSTYVGSDDGEEDEDDDDELLVQANNTADDEHTQRMKTAQTPSKTDKFTSHSGEGCIQILLDNTMHPEFISACTQHHLAVSLVHAMRLLKIFEIKIAKKMEQELLIQAEGHGLISNNSSLSGGISGESNSNNLMSEMSRETDANAPVTAAERVKSRDARETNGYLLAGATRRSSERACKLLEVLCAEPSTLDLLNSSKILEKLLVYPLSALPEKALHLQKDVAAVLEKLCSRPLSSDQVWLLHDQNAVLLMTRNLKELCASAESTKLIAKSNGDLRVAAASASAVSSPAVGTPAAASKPTRRDSVRTRGSKFSKTTLTSGSSLTGSSTVVEEADEEAQEETCAGQDARGASESVSVLAQENTMELSDIGSPTAWSPIAHDYNVPGGASNNKVAIDTTESSRNAILRGEAAEKAEMWVVATNVLVSIICASMSVNPVLMNDFEYSGGYKLMVDILQRSSTRNCTQTLMAITRLFTDPHKGPEEVLSFPTIGAVILEVLVGVLHLTESVDAADENDIHKFVRISQGIVRAQRDGKLNSGWEVLVQNVAYILLTLYSNQPKNCMVLEGSYQFLSILLLCVPSLTSPDSISAVLTTLNFVCHSVEEQVKLPLIALCAATGVCVNLGLNMQDTSMSSLQSLPSSPMPLNMNYSHSARVTTANVSSPNTSVQITSNSSKTPAGTVTGTTPVSRSALAEKHYRDLVIFSFTSILQSFDSIATIRSKYALQILRCGFLQHLVRPLFENLCFYFNQENALLKQEQKKSTNDSEERVLPSISDDAAEIYVKIVELLLFLISKSPHAAEEIRQSGLNVIMRNLIRADQASLILTRHCLRLPEVLSTCETTHLEESIQTVFDVLHQLNVIHQASSLDMTSPDKMQLQNSCEKVRILFHTLYNVLEHAEDVVWVWNKFKGFQEITDTISSLKPFFKSHATTVNNANEKTHTMQVACDSLSAIMECLSLELSLAELDEHERSREARRKALNLADALLDADVFRSPCASDCMDLVINLMCGFAAVINDAKSENRVAPIACPEMSLLILKVLPVLSDQLALKALQAVERHALVRFDGYQLLAESGFVFHAIEYHAPLLRGEVKSTPAKQEVCEYMWQMIKNITLEYLTVSDFSLILKLLVRPTLVHTDEKHTNENAEESKGKNDGRYKLLVPFMAMTDNFPDVKAGAVDAMQLLTELAFRFSKPVTAHIAPYVSLGYGASSKHVEQAHLHVTVADTSRLLSGGHMTFSCWIRCIDPKPAKAKPITIQTAKFGDESTLPAPQAQTPGKKVSVGAVLGAAAMPPNPPSSASKKTFASLGVLAAINVGTFIPIATFSTSTNCSPQNVYLEVLLNVKTYRIVVYCRGNNFHKAMIFQPRSSHDDGDWLHIALTLKKSKRFGLVGGKTQVQVYLNGEECDIMAGSTDSNCSTIELNISSHATEGALKTHMYIGKSIIAAASDEKSSRSFIEQNGEMLPNCASGYVNRWQVGPVLLFDSALLHPQLAYMFVRGPDYCGTQPSTGSHDSPTTENLTSLSTDTLSRYTGSQGSTDVKTLLGKLGLDGLEYVVDPVVEKSAFAVLTAHVPLLPASLLEYNARNSICRYVTHQFTAAESRREGRERTTSRSSQYDDSTQSPSNPKSSNSRTSSPIFSTPGSAGSADRKSPSANQSTFSPNNGYNSSKSSLDGYFHEVDKAKHARQAELNTAQATKLSLLNANSMDNSQPIARSVNGWHKACPETFASCISALGGPVILFPLLQIASSEKLLCQILLLLRCSLIKNKANLKRMQEDGYQMLAFLIARKPRFLITLRVVNLLFLFSSNEDISKYSNFNYVRQELLISSDQSISFAHNGSTTNGLLLVDTVSLYHLYMNHHVWKVTSFDVAMSVLGNLGDLVDDCQCGMINSHRLSALGVARWVLLLAAYGADHADHTTDSSIFSLALDDSLTHMEEKVKNAAANSAANDTDRTTRWKMQRFEIEIVSNECEASEPFLSKAILCIVKNIMRVELRKRDIEMIGLLILYTFIPARPTYVDEDDSAGREHLSTFTLLRVYLIRLLFTLFDDGIEDPLHKPAGDPNRRSQSPTMLIRDISATFRAVFTPDWFLGILEKVSDLPTFTDGLRLLALFIQKDAIFCAEFVAAQGLRNITAILICRPQELSVMLPLLALFFQVPMHILPYANQVKSAEKMTRLLELEEAVGPSLQEPAHSELYNPLYKLIMACVNINIRFIQDSVEDEAAVNRCRFVTSVVLSTLNYGFEHTETFKEFMQERSVLATLTTSALGCSTGMDDFGTYATVTYEEEGTSLESTIEEEYVPGDTARRESIHGNVLSVDGTPMSIDKNPKLKRASKVRYVNDVGDHEKEMPSADQKVHLIGTEGQLLRDMIYNCIECALVDVNHSAILASLLLSLPAHAVGSYLTGCQRMLLDISFEVVKDIMDKGNSDITFCHNLANALTLLIPLSKADIYHDTTIQLQVFKISVYCLDKMINYLPSLQTGGMGMRMSPSKAGGKTTGSVFQVLEPLVRSFGTTARYFAVRCIHSMIGNVDISRDDRDAAVRNDVLANIRQNMAILLANTFEDSVDPLLEAIPEKKGLFGFGNNNNDDDSGRGSESRGLGFGIIFGRSKSEKTPQGSSSSNKINSLHSLHNKESAAAALEAAIRDKTRWSQVFCAKMMTSCFSFFLDDNSDCRIESARIFALVVIHKRGLMENLFFSPLKTGQIVASGQNGKEGVALSITQRDNEFFRAGLEMIAPSEGMLGHYESFLRGLTADNDGEEHRMAAFTFWLTDNEVRCGKLFEGIDKALTTYTEKNTLDANELHKQIMSLKHIAKGHADDFNDYNEMREMDASMKRAEDLVRKGELIIGAIRRWRVNGFSHVGNGGMVWHRSWQMLQSGSIWGYFAIAPHTNSVTKVWRVSASEGPERTRRRLEQEFSTSSTGLLYFPVEETHFKPLQPVSHRKSMAASSVAGLTPAGKQSAIPLSTMSPEKRSVDESTLVVVSSSISPTVTSTHSPFRADANPEQSEMPTANLAYDIENEHEDDNEEESEDAAEVHDRNSSQGMLEFMKRMSVTGQIKKMKEGHNIVNLQDYVIADEAHDENAENARAEGAEESQNMISSNTLMSVSPVSSKDGSTTSAGNSTPTSVTSKLSSSLHIDPIKIDNASSKKISVPPSPEISNSDRHSFNDLRERSHSEASEAGSDSMRNAELLSRSLTYNDSEHADITRTDSSYSISSESVDEIPPEKDNDLPTPVHAEELKETKQRRESINSGQKRLGDIARKKWAKASRVEANRTLALQELVRGIIGHSEWDAKGTIFYNVQKIVGLELQRAVVVLTPKKLHILGGFRAADRNKTKLFASTAVIGEGSVKGADCVLEWVGLNPSADEGSLKAVEEATQNAKDLQNATTNISIADASRLPREETSEETWLKNIWSVMLGTNAGYVVMPLQELYSIFKRRHHLKYTALEITDTSGYSLLFACASQDAMSQLLVSMLEAELPASIFRRTLGAKNMQMLRGASHMYNRLMATFVSSLTQMWERGQISNFEYLMHLNAAAGRSFLDLTQYPIFPWVLADYTSEKLNLNDEATFRDLSRPMGALNEKRADQFRERYSSLHEIAQSSGYDNGFDDEDHGNTATPPFFYGTHYSCAGYVLHYLNRLQPYADMSIALQGGRFDNPDRLFIDVAASWASASTENLQDVRELIPEFYYCPEFLTNHNKFNFGRTQKDVEVQDVVLPRWANGDPHEFVKKHREALESKYVSENLNDWIDLIFGYKQRGEAAVSSMNVFIHLTYEGEVDVDAISDPLLRSATISQINNFGQCPSKLFSKKHPRRVVPDIFRKALISSPRSLLGVGTNDESHHNANVFGNDDMPTGHEDDTSKQTANAVTDATALAWHEHISPPLCVVGANNIVELVKVGKTEHFTRLDISTDRLSIADIQLHKGTISAVNKGGLLLPQALFGKKVIRFGGPSCGFTVLANSLVSNALSNAAANINAGTSGLGSTSLSSMVAGITLSAPSQSTRYNAVVADHDKEIYSVHDRLHEGVITCMERSKDGTLLFTGSKDCSIRMWSTALLLSSRRIECELSFVGHVYPIVCLDYCAEFHTLVSGCEGGRACIWDTRSGCLLRMLGEEPDAGAESVLSVSMSAASGLIAVLSRSVLTLYSLNGTLLAQQKSGQGRSSERNMDGDASVVLAISTADWQDGIACITGHASGAVYLWKLRVTVTRGDQEVHDSASDADVNFSPPSVPGTPTASSPQQSKKTTSSGVSRFGTALGVKRTLYVAYTLPRTHTQCITALSIISNTVSTIAQTMIGSKRDVVNRAHADAGTLELFVGDAEGFVSRWNATKLDSLIHSDKVALVS